MTDDEQRAWVAQLGRSRERQIAVIEELLHFAYHDHMSSADRTVCRTQLQRLRDEGRAWRQPPARHRHVTIDIAPADKAGSLPARFPSGKPAAHSPHPL